MTDHSSLLKGKNNLDIVERPDFEAWWSLPIRLGGEDVPLWQCLSPRQKESCSVAFKAGKKTAAAEITRLREDNKKLSDKAEALRKALVLVMDYPDVRKYLGRQVANVADAAIAATKEQQ